MSLGHFASRSLRNKILIAVLPLVAVSLGVMCVLTYRSTSELIIDSRQEYLNQVVESKKESLELWMSAREQQAETIAEMSVFRQALHGERTEEAGQRLETLFGMSDCLENVFLADSHGRIVMDGIAGASVGIDISSLDDYRINFQKAESGETWFGDAKESPATGRPVALVTVPLMENGTLLGIIGTPVELTAFSDQFIANTDLGETGYVFLLGRDGITLAHKQKEYILNVDVTDFDFGRRMYEMKEGLFHYDWKGVDKVASFTTIGQTGWMVAATEEMAAFRAEARRVAWIIGIIGTLILLLITAVLIFATSYLVEKPLKFIAEGARRLSVGDVRLEGMDQKAIAQINDREDELGEIGKAFSNLILNQQEKTAAAAGIAEGDLSMEIRAASAEDELGRAMIRMAASVRELNSEVAGLVEEAVGGKLDSRADTGKFDGEYAKLVGKVNELLDTTVRPIQETSRVLSAAADKDLTSRMEGEYRGQFNELKTNVNNTIQSLDEALAQVAFAVEQVSSASSQISSGSQTLARGANEQASSIEEVSSSLEEMASMTKQNSDNASQANSLSNSAYNATDKGREDMRRMNEAIARIKESSDKTAKIVKTIDEIAFQTNLLALNAAVEAARAGDAGKGFAVVAEEVRSLAQRSAEAAKNTAEMIKESVNNSELGVEITEKLSAVLEEIAEGNSSVKSIIAEIAAAAGEQSQGVDQINSAISQIDQVTQQNASNSEESASAAEELNSQAEELQNMIAQFRISQRMESGRSAGEATRIPRIEKSGNGPAHVPGGSADAPERKTAATGGKRKGDNGNGKKGGNGRQQGSVPSRSPEEIIPLDDGDFEDF